MSGRGRRRKSRNKGVGLGLVYGGIGLAIIISILVATVLLNMGTRSLDASACPVDRYDSVTIVLIDLTDPLNPIQAAALKNTILKVRDGVPRYGRIEIYPLRSMSQRTLEPLFVGCNPGSARDVESPIYGNPQLAERMWHRQFADKMNGVLTTIQELPIEEKSPLFEGIQSVAVTGFATPLADRAPDKRLVLISDMIHFTPELSMYQGAPQFVDFKSQNYYLRVKPNLDGANVDVFLVVRESKRSVQQPQLYKFWVEFFAASDGYLRDWVPLQ